LFIVVDLKFVAVNW